MKIDDYSISGLMGLSCEAVSLFITLIMQAIQTVRVGDATGYRHTSAIVDYGMRGLMGLSCEIVLLP